MRYLAHAVKACRFSPVGPRAVVVSRAVGPILSSAALTLAIVGTPLACSFDPYERYASTVRHDVGVPAATLTRTVVRLQSTIVHGHVPLDSAKVWTHELTGTVQVFRERAAHLQKAAPPDTNFLAIRDGLVTELGTVADSVAALNADIAPCVGQTHGSPSPPPAAAPDSSGSPDSDPTADCSATVGVALARLVKGVSYSQDEIRWTLERAARKLATHGVLLGRSA
jgi:hypothetical protein